MWESSYFQLVITVFSLADKMSDHWMNNLLGGHILTGHKHTLHLLVTCGPLVSLAWMKLVSSDNRGLWSAHTYDKTCIETSILDTGNFQCHLNVHTSGISPCSCIHSWCQSSSVTMLPVTCIVLLTGWSRFNKGLPLLVLACWEVCTLVSHQIDLSHLGITCQLLSKQPDLACQEPVKVYITVIDCLGDKLFILEEKPKDVSMKYLGCFWGVLSQSNLDLYCILPFISWLVSLLEACKQVKCSPEFIWLWLAELFIFFLDCVKY